MGWITVPGLVRYIALFQLLVFVILQTKPDFDEVLMLDPVKVMGGEVWRLVTCLFVPPARSVVWFLFAAMFLMFMSDALEALMGPFRVTLYVLSFLVVQWIGTLVLGGVLRAAEGGMDVPKAIAPLLTTMLPMPHLLMSNLFFALAVLAPKLEIRLYFVVPVQVRWIALVDAVLLLYPALRMPQILLPVAWGLLPFLVWFVPGMVRGMRQRAKVGARRAEFKSHSLPEAEAFHRCKVCGRTDAGNPELEFRVAADGEEYCAAHLPGSGQ